MLTVTLYTDWVLRGCTDLARWARQYASRANAASSRFSGGTLSTVTSPGVGAMPDVEWK